MATLPEQAKALLDSPTFATVATIEPDGQPQLSVVWVARDGDDILFNTAAGRRKPQNIARDDRVSVLMFPADSPYTYLEVRGRAVMQDDTGAEFINELSRKYLGRDYPWLKPGERRLTVRVKADRVVFHG